MLIFICILHSRKTDLNGQNNSHVYHVCIWIINLYVFNSRWLIADRITGTRGATLIGAILIIIGHICLSLPFAMVGLFTSMFFIIVGSGLMKPNISNIVGRLYPENDVRMDAGFVIFYMSVNMGRFTNYFTTLY